MIVDGKGACTVVWLRKLECRIRDALQSLRGRIDRSLFDAARGIFASQYRILTMISSIPPVVMYLALSVSLVAYLILGYE